MKYGYARVSTDDQNPALQLSALNRAGCQTVFKDEGLSGTTTERPALLRCLKQLKPGDTLNVWKLDRLGRSVRDLITMHVVFQYEIRTGPDERPAKSYFLKSPRLKYFSSHT